MNYNIYSPKENFLKMLRYLGLEVHRINVLSNSYFQLCKALNAFDINIIFDIGANIGQFTTELRSFGYKEKVISFEPLSDAYQNLVKVAAHDSNWKIHKQGAIGNFDGEIEINIAGNSASSSILPMLDYHISAAKGTAYIGAEKVQISKLDSIASQYLSPSDNLLIKIDTQGFEWQVLDGGADTLKKAKGIACELSLVPLYEGQHLWLDVLDRLQLEGFTLWSFNQGFIDSKNGRTLQVDATFFRST
jgi:FkbM family methyltransferase